MAIATAAGPYYHTWSVTDWATTTATVSLPFSIRTGEYIQSITSSIDSVSIYELADTTTTDSITTTNLTVQTNWGTWTTNGWRVTYSGHVLFEQSPYSGHVLFEQSPRERLRKIIESRYAPAYVGKFRDLPKPADVREQRARETLKRVIGERKFQDFLKKGFITVQAKSGLVYQIFPAHRFTTVWNRGTIVDMLCVVLQGDFPPTDSLIARYLMILNNEDHFRSLAVKHTPYIPGKPLKKVADHRSLTTIYKEMKAA